MDSASHLLFGQVVEKLSEVAGASIGPVLTVVLVASCSAICPNPERDIFKDNGGVDSDFDGDLYAEVVLYARHVGLY